MQRARARHDATKFDNPHGLPDDEQVTSARDMAILAQAIISEFPEHEMLFRIPTLRSASACFATTIV